MAQQESAQNGTRESLGEMRGEVNAMARQVEALTDAVNHMRLTLAALSTDFQVHTALHKAAETAAVLEREERRFSTQRTIALASLGSGTVVAIVTFLLRNLGG